MAMLKSLSLNLRMSEVRQKITEFPDDGADTDRDALTGEYASLDQPISGSTDNRAIRRRERPRRRAGSARR